MNYTDSQLAQLAAANIGSVAHAKFWNEWPELTFEQSVDWFQKVAAGTHEALRSDDSFNPENMKVSWLSLDFKIAAGQERTQHDPAQVDGWEKRIELTLIPTEESEEDKS